MSRIEPGLAAPPSQIDALIDSIIGPSATLDGALCAQTDPEAFYPDKGGSSRPAKAVCAECPVRGQCLEWALEHNERFGVWGGTTEKERQAIRKQREAA